MKHRKRPPKDDNLGIRIQNCLKNRKYKQSLHALERIDKRKVTFQDVLYVLETGRQEEAKDAYDEIFQNWKYSIRGKTLEDVDIRIIITINEENVVIITVVNLTMEENI